MQDFEQKHLEYDRAAKRRQIAMDCYEGGERIEKNTKYLIRHPLESEKQYIIRLERATYRNLVAPVVDVFSSSINRGRKERVLPAALVPVELNADRDGTSANSFFADVTRLAAAGGVNHVLIDMEPQRGESLAEDIASGRRTVPYFVGVDPDDLWNWAEDSTGLKWAVIHGAGIDSGDDPFAAPTRYETLTVWTRTGWTRLRKDIGTGSGSASGTAGTRSGGNAAYALDAEGVHPLGVVPLVPFVFERDPKSSSMIGTSAIDDVLSLALRVYRRDSELDKAQFDTAVPVWVICGLSESEWESAFRSSSMSLMSVSPDGLKVQCIEPSGNSFASLAASIAEDEKSIRETGLRMIRKDSAAAESAEAKQLDKEQLDAQLATFARRCAAAESSCWNIAALWLGIKDKAIETPYNEDYSVHEAKVLTKEDLLRMAQAGLLSKEDYLTQMQKLGYLPEDFDVEGAVDRIMQGVGSNMPQPGNLADMLAS